MQRLNVKADPLAGSASLFVRLSDESGVLCALDWSWKTAIF